MSKDFQYWKQLKETYEAREKLQQYREELLQDFLHISSQEDVIKDYYFIRGKIAAIDAIEEKLFNVEGEKPYGNETSSDS